MNWNTDFDAGLYVVCRDGFAALGHISHTLAVFVGAWAGTLFEYDRGAGLKRSDRSVALGRGGGGLANVTASCAGSG